MDITPADILDFWYSDRIEKSWFASTPALDREIRQRFEPLWARAAQDRLAQWHDTPDGCLALAIVLDQFPLNMFRGAPESFMTESKARDVARHAIARGFDHKLPSERLDFLYMPFMHSESVEDQDYAVNLFEAARLQSNLKFAKHHREIIPRFGRFPHRNAILGRESTTDELDYLNSDDGFKG